MKKNPNNVWGDIGTLKLMADVLHSVLVNRGYMYVAAEKKEATNESDSSMEKAIKRMLKSVDYKAATAMNVLKKRLKPSSSHAAASVCISISPRKKK